MERFAIGQRWLSTTQPELGLGIVTGVQAHRVSLHFPACQESRTYAIASAPLRRVKLAPGDQITTQDGNHFTVKEIREHQGLLIYVGDERELHETSLPDTLTADRPENRLLAHEVDPPALYRMRRSLLLQRFKSRIRPVCGLCGGRVALFPHQLFVAREVASRQAPRVLLADEVGLGKTIEAGLILHQLLVTGRAQRVLIVVPEPLIFQWYLEMLRRFQLPFAIFEEERVQAIEATDSEANPFLDNQLILTAISWLENNAQRVAQAAAAGWDVVVVDEAHHLAWSHAQASPAYVAVETIARSSAGLLLLTATPEQLGREGHFARLRLLDPDRYDRFDRFEEEMAYYGKISRLADRVRSGDPDLSAVREELSNLLATNPLPQEKSEVMQALLDAHGTGRVVFRNRREALSGFPARQVHFTALPAEPLAKIRHIASLLQKTPGEKFLLLCRSPETVQGIERDLRQVSNLDFAVFHEGLTLIQRDRNAAWFADPEGGARLLLCSEIGGEGRNFQFAHHLILFDLPPDPGLLEQRIGRLDRIGQSSKIHLHVLFRQGTAEELYARWYHEGLGAFAHTLHGSEMIHARFHAELSSLGDDTWEAAWPGLKTRTIAFKKQLLEELAAGRDHLLELSSFDREKGERLAAAIRELDEDRELEQTMLQLWDQFGINVEDLGRRQYLLSGHLPATPAFPAMPGEKYAVTFDRPTALAREDLAFLSWDHPLVTSSVDAFLASSAGQAGFLEMEGPEGEGLLLDLTFLLEPTAPARLHLDRFLPAFPVRVLIDHQARDRTSDFPAGSLQAAKPGDAAWLNRHAPALTDLVANLIKRGRRYAQQAVKQARTRALHAMETLLQSEIERLLRLRALGHPVREPEIALARAEKEELARHILESRMRLDSVRLIRFR